ncbi:hypothetical protein O181_038664 [Austropuccinia psidii MF-1]|uniref:Uncharacterized protein n=1 Tax=Austropuccinia psidii MF-1 TaxID=1389203 RepID=A0A9Q3D8T1_9BASI|nr:hypothetical protein [Austropuccinia psidii MF-1]
MITQFVSQLIALLKTFTSTIDIYKKPNLIHNFRKIVNPLLFLNAQGATFKHFQYKQQIKKLKSAIAPKSLPKIPTSASRSEFPQIVLDQVFPADYSQLTQSTFSTPLGVNSTAQKPHSISQSLPPQDLGMIISAILSLQYNIPCRVSHILKPTLNLLIKSSISSSGGHPTPAFHIPQDLSTIFEQLQWDPVIQSYICCAQFFFLNDLTESVTTYQPHCKPHNDPNDHDPPCTQSLGKFIYSFEPRIQNTTDKTFRLSTIHKLACQISPVGWNYEFSASKTTIPNSQRFFQI